MAKVEIKTGIIGPSEEEIKSLTGKGAERGLIPWISQERKRAIATALGLATAGGAGAGIGVAAFNWYLEHRPAITEEVSAAQIPPAPEIGVSSEAKTAPEYIERATVFQETIRTPVESVKEKEAETRVERATLIYPGDILSGIGERLGVSWQEIAKLNNIEPPYTIYWGQQLIIPGREESLGQYFEQRPPMTFEASADFNTQEREWINETAAKITEVFTDVIGPSFKTGMAPVERGKPGEFHTEAWCYGSSEEYPAGLIKFRNDYDPIENTHIYAHEMSHLWLAGWENEIVKVFGDTRNLYPHVFVDALANLADYQFGESTSAEGDIFIQAYWRDPDFYLKLRKRFEEEGRPIEASEKQWQKWAEEASPGFNAWLEMVKEGPRVELPEPTGKIFVWSERAAELAEDNSRPIAFCLDWVAGPVEWFMPWQGTAKGASRRISESRYLVYKVVARGIPHPESGPEGSLPYYSLEDSFRGQPLGEWK